MPAQAAEALTITVHSIALPHTQALSLARETLSNLPGDALVAQLQRALLSQQGLSAQPGHMSGGRARRAGTGASLGSQEAWQVGQPAWRHLQGRHSCITDTCTLKGLPTQRSIFMYADKSAITHYCS